MAECKRVGLEVPSIEVKFRNLKIGANVKTGTRALPTLMNYTRDALEVWFSIHMNLVSSYHNAL